MKSESIFRLLTFAILLLSGVLAWTLYAWWWWVTLLAVLLLLHSYSGFSGVVDGLKRDLDHMRTEAFLQGWQRARRIARTFFGGALMLLGVIMIPLPGPGMLVILLGLGVLATEYEWARRWMARLRNEMNRLRGRSPQPEDRANPNPSDPPETPRH